MSLDERFPDPVDAGWPDAVDRLVAGDASATDRAAGSVWLEQHPGAGTFFTELRAELEPEPAARFDADRVLQRIYAASPAAGGWRETRSPQVRSPRWWSRVPLVGGVAALGAVAAVVIAVSGTRGRSPSVERVARSYSTTIGQTASFTLADGSRVVLAPQSRLDVMEHFGGSSRALRLLGEAYFEVDDASASPFLVRTGDVTTRVLGTSFDVRRYQADRAARIAVLRGRVAVASANASATVVAGQVSSATDSTMTTIAPKSVDDYAAWKDRELVFTNERASSVMETVGRWYGYTFRFTDSTLASSRVTGKFRLAATMETMAAIESLLNASIQFDSTTVTLSPRRAKKAPAVRRSRQPVQSPHTEVGR